MMEKRLIKNIKNTFSMGATQTSTDTSVIAHGAIDVVSDTSHFHLHVFGRQEDDTRKQRGETFKQ